MRDQDSSADRLRGARGRGKAGRPASNKRFRLKRFAEIKLSTNPNYLIKGILPRVGLAVIWGPPKCGKSFWTFDAVMHVALDWLYRGRKVQQGTVVYCALEGGTGFSRRVEAWRQRYLAADHEDVPFYLLDVPLDLVADCAALIETISGQVSDAPSPVCIVIDTLNRALAGSENKPEDMAKFIRAADALRVAFNCLMVIVHHCGLEEKRPRGHSSLPGADDVQIKVERDSNGTGDTITTTVEHMKDDEAGAIVTSRLERVELGADDDGEDMSSCVIVACDGAAPQKATKSKRDWGEGRGAQTLRRIVMNLLAERGVELRPWADGPMVRALKVEVVRDEFIRSWPAVGKDQRDAKTLAFRRALASAIDKQVIVSREIGGEDFVWLASADPPIRTSGHVYMTPSAAPARDGEDEPGTPEAGAPPNVGNEGMPAFLTTSVKEQLRAFGCTEKYIHDVVPADAHKFLAERRKLRAVLTAWFAALGCAQPCTAKRLMAAGAGGKLKTALVAAANGRPLEDWLRENSGIEVEQLTLCEAGTDKDGVPQWTLKLQVNPDRGSGAD
jgi:hypothetical protein